MIPRNATALSFKGVMSQPGVAGADVKRMRESEPARTRYLGSQEVRTSIAAPVSTGAQPEVADADRQDQDAHHPSDQEIRKK